MKKTIAITLSTLIIFWACGGGESDIIVTPAINQNYIDSVERLENYVGECEVVFIGDSRISGGGWEDYRDGWCNFGIGGDTAGGILDRIDAVIAVNPSQVVIQVGYNDLAREYSPLTTMDIIKTISERIQFNGADFFITSTLLSTFTDMNSKIETLNNLIYEYCEENQAVWVDVNANLAPDGQLTNTTDGIHLTPEGYSIFYTTIDSYL